MESLIDALLEWIADRSPYQANLMPHPFVQQLSAEDLTWELYGGVASLMPESGVDPRIFALFSQEDGPHGTIYLLRADLIDGAEEFEDPTDNPLFREILLHELVHYAQWKSGTSETWQCLSAGEAEAYQLGGAYLKGTYTTDPLPNRNFWGRVYSNC